MLSRRRMIRLVLSHAGLAATGFGLLAAAATVSGPPVALAQGETAPSEALLVIPGADGAPVALRSGPSWDQTIVTTVAPYELLTPLGPAHFDGVTRWLPARTAANQVGWIAEQYAAVVAPASAPAPAVAAAPAPPPAPPAVAAVPPAQPAVEAAPPAPPAASAVAAPPPVAAAAPPPPPPPPPPPSAPTAAPTPPPPAAMAASVREPTTTGARAPTSAWRPLEIEAKLKYPEAKGRHQEITVWVTRDGVPIEGAMVTIHTEDDEDEPMRILEPTNIEGRTRREFAIGRKKGSIELVVSAVAADGGQGKTTASYFRR